MNTGNFILSGSVGQIFFSLSQNLFTESEIPQIFLAIFPLSFLLIKLKLLFVTSLRFSFGFCFLGRFLLIGSSSLTFAFSLFDSLNKKFIFHIILVQACLRAPHVVADEAKLAIVFTYFLFSFFLFSSSSSSPPSTFHPLRGISRA